MTFDPSQYGSKVKDILALDGDGLRPMPLAYGRPLPEATDALAGQTGKSLFPESFSPDGALSGLYLYFSAYDRSHEISQDLSTVEGSFWHGIMHRQEPDAGNAGYWFRRVGKHAIFPQLRDAASGILDETPGGLEFHVGTEWDPFAFIDFCESARKQTANQAEQVAMAIQLAEWQLLFDFCARPRSRA